MLEYTLVLVSVAVLSQMAIPPPCQPKERARNVPGSRGRWMKVQVKFKMQAHIISGVVMDIAAFKVSHSEDNNAATLQAARARSSSIGTMERYMRGFDSAQNSRCCPATTHRQQ